MSYPLSGTRNEESQQGRQTCSSGMLKDHIIILNRKSMNLSAKAGQASSVIQEGRLWSKSSKVSSVTHHLLKGGRVEKQKLKLCARMS